MHWFLWLLLVVQVVRTYNNLKHVSGGEQWFALTPGQAAVSACISLGLGVGILIYGGVL